MVFGVDTETVNQVCTSILQLYTRTPASQEELEERVELARKAVDDAKVKARAQLVAQNAENTLLSTPVDSIVDSRTSSPIKYSDQGGTSSKSLEVISAINRLKQHQLGSKSSSPATVNSTTALTTTNNIVNSTQNSAANTPIKLEKSPRTLSSSFRSKRSRSPSLGDHSRPSSRGRRTDHTDSSGDDRQGGSPTTTTTTHLDHRSIRDRYRNGGGNHQNVSDQHYNDGDDHRPRQYRESNAENVNSRTRSPTPPRSYITSRVSSAVSSSNYNDYVPAKYQQRSPSYEERSSEPPRSYVRSSVKSSSANYRDRDSRYDDGSSSRYASSSGRSSYDYRDRGSRRDYDDGGGYETSRRGGGHHQDEGDHHRHRPRDYRDDRGYDDGGGNRSRSRSPYRSTRDHYHKGSSSSSSSNRNKSRY